MNKSFLDEFHFENCSEWILEIGPRLAFATAWSSNCESICKACGISSVNRVEKSRRYKVFTSSELSDGQKEDFAAKTFDRMTECIYSNPLTSFISCDSSCEVYEVPILSEGQNALKELNISKGLGFDDWDIQFYSNMFVDVLKRNPTDVECFDLAQSNSEHSRHWFFSGNMYIDSVLQDQSLFDLVKATLPASSNSVIAFHDNSSVCRTLR